MKKYILRVYLIIIISAVLAPNITLASSIIDDSTAAMTPVGHNHLIKYNGYVYGFGYSNDNTEPLAVYRSQNEVDWQPVIEKFGNSFADITDTIVFQGKLYISLGDSSTPLYVTSDGLNFYPVDNITSQVAEEDEGQHLFIFGDQLYLTIRNEYANKVKIYKSSDGINWHRVQTTGYFDTHAKRILGQSITKVVATNNEIFALISVGNSNSGHALIYSNDGKDWEKLDTTGLVNLNFAKLDNHVILFAIHNQVYLATPTHGHKGAKLFYNITDKSIEPIITTGLESIDGLSVMLKSYQTDDIYYGIIVKHVNGAKQRCIVNTKNFTNWNSTYCFDVTDQVKSTMTFYGNFYAIKNKIFFESTGGFLFSLPKSIYENQIN